MGCPAGVFTQHTNFPGRASRRNRISKESRERERRRRSAWLRESPQHTSSPGTSSSPSGLLEKPGSPLCGISRMEVEVWGGVIQEGRKGHLGESEKGHEACDPTQGDRQVKTQVHVSEGLWRGDISQSARFRQTLFQEEGTCIPTLER